MPAKYRRLIRELDSTDDLAEVMLIVHDLISDIYERVQAKGLTQIGTSDPSLYWQRVSCPIFYLKAQWHRVRSELYDKLPWYVKEDLRGQELLKTTERYVLQRAAESAAFRDKESPCAT